MHLVGGELDLVLAIGAELFLRWAHVEIDGSAVAGQVQRCQI